MVDVYVLRILNYGSVKVIPSLQFCKVVDVVMQHAEQGAVFKYIEMQRVTPTEIHKRRKL